MSASTARTNDASGKEAWRLNLGLNLELSLELTQEKWGSHQVFFFLWGGTRRGLGQMEVDRPVHIYPSLHSEVARRHTTPKVTAHIDGLASHIELPKLKILNQEILCKKFFRGIYDGFR